MKAAGLDELDKWVRLYNWLLKNAKRGGFNARGSVMKRSSWAVTSLTNDIASTYEIIIRLLKGSNATVYVNGLQVGSPYNLGSKWVQRQFYTNLFHKLEMVDL